MSHPKTVGSDCIKSWPKNERPREKLLAEGPEKQTDADLLAVILRIGRGTFKKGVAGQNVQSFARALLSDFGSLKGLDRAPIPDLLKAPGLSDAKVAQLKAAFELGKRVSTRKLIRTSFGSSEAVAKHFRPQLLNKGEETVLAVFLNGQNQNLAEKLITQGTPTQATVYVRSVIEQALRVSAAAILLVHNHPSGSCEPSAGDDDTTRDLLKACKLVGLVMLDHIIVGDEDHYSYNDEGCLEDILNE